MPRFFIEVAYKGSHYSGFQIQQNANTIQSELEKAIALLHRTKVTLTGSSRTDAGVHALQNYFHFDFEGEINRHFVYKMNAILPVDIVVKQLYKMPDHAHARFDAVSREYEYRIYRNKNPFLKGLALYYPYAVDLEIMQQAASIIEARNNFFAFSKTNTQVTNYHCTIYKSKWLFRDDLLIYNIEGNRFLRGMVRLLTASMLKTGRGKLTINEFASLFESSSLKCGFSVSSEGLFLKAVKYPPNYFDFFLAGF
jgi:tRNA pseudouridine38-40 synthase